MKIIVFLGRNENNSLVWTKKCNGFDSIIYTELLGEYLFSMRYYYYNDMNEMAFS